MKRQLALCTTFLITATLAGVASAQDYSSDPHNNAGDRTDVQTQDNVNPATDRLDRPNEGADLHGNEAATTAYQAQGRDAHVMGGMVIMAGDEIYNDDGDGIGTVEGVVMGENPMLIVSVGEFLGLGGRNVLVDPSAVNERADGGLSVSYTEDHLRQMEAFEEDDLP